MSPSFIGTAVLSAVLCGVFVPLIIHGFVKSVEPAPPAGRTPPRFTITDETVGGSSYGYGFVLLRDGQTGKAYLASRNGGVVEVSP